MDQARRAGLRDFLRIEDRTEIDAKSPKGQRCPRPSLKRTLSSGQTRNRSDLPARPISGRSCRARKRHTAEEIVAKLRQVDVLTAQGRTVAEVIRSIGVTEVTYYRWRNEYGGLKSDQVKRLKELEAENARLRRAVSDLTLDKMILKEAAKGNF